MADGITGSSALERQLFSLLRDPETCRASDVCEAMLSGGQVTERDLHNAFPGVLTLLQKTYPPKGLPTQGDSKPQKVVVDGNTIPFRLRKAAGHEATPRTPPPSTTHLFFDPAVGFGRDAQGCTMGHWAVRYRRAVQLRFFLRFVRVVDTVVDANGDTLLHYLVSSGEETSKKEANATTEMVRMLLERGASPDVKNIRGRSPRDRAVEWKRDAIVSVFDEIARSRCDAFSTGPVAHLLREVDDDVNLGRSAADPPDDAEEKAKRKATQQSDRLRQQNISRLRAEKELEKANKYYSLEQQKLMKDNAKLNTKVHQLEEQLRRSKAECKALRQELSKCQEQAKAPPPAMSARTSTSGASSPEADP